MSALILGLDQTGMPNSWLTFRQAIEQKATDQIAWSLGEDIVTYHGGIRRVDGIQSSLTVPSIIAIKNQSGHAPTRRRKISLTNKALFARDRHFCAYCGRHFQSSDDLSRDHIHPTSRDGKDTWMNVITACRPCNRIKDDRTPEEAGMPLIWIPFVPNFYESLILANRHILADQYEFLESGVSDHFRKRDSRGGRNVILDDPDDEDLD